MLLRRLTLALSSCVLCASGASAQQRVEVLGHYDNTVGSSNAASEGAVTARLIAHRPTLRPGEVLEFVPGLIVTQHSGDGKANQYFLRGFNLDHGTDFATWIDGMPVNMPSHAHGQGYTDLNFLIPELVRRIDYRKGPYRASDGDFASAGSARLSLADSAGFAQLTLGENGYRRAVLAQDTAVAGNGRVLGALELAANDGPWRLPQDLGKVNAWLRWSRSDEASGSSVTLMGYRSRWNATDQVPLRAVQDGRIDRFGTVDDSDGGRSARYSLSARHAGKLADGDWQAGVYAIGSRLNLWSNFTYFLDDEVNGDQFEQAERRRVLGGELSRRWTLQLGGRDAQLTLGASWRQERLSPVGLYATMARQRLATTQESRVRQSLGSLYAELDTAWTPWLRSVAGLRADAARFDVSSNIAENSGRTDDQLLSPKLTLIAAVSPTLELFANAGRGFHSNDARGTVARVAPREGTPVDAVPPLVRTRGGELGLRAEPVKGLTTSLALWRLDLDSELVFVGDAGDTEANRGSRRRGIESNTHWQIGPMWLLDFDLSASRARFRDFAPEGQRVPGAVDRVAAFGLHYGGEGPFTAHVQLRHFGPRDLVEDGSQRSQATTLAYLRAGWRLQPGLTLSLDVFNLFDRQASDIDYFYESRLRGEASAVADRHFHPVEPRSARLTLRWAL